MAEFRIFRFDPDRSVDSHFDKFHIQVKKGMSVLDGLMYIREHLDSSLTFRSNCRSGNCGSCGMHINGKYRLACSTKITQLENWEIDVRPLAHLTVVRDLVVDMRNFFQAYEKVQPFVEPSPEEVVLQAPEALGEGADCVMCGACYSSCPVTSSNPEFPGPHGLLKGARFLADARDQQKEGRIAVMSDANGLARCHSAYNCRHTCPKGLDPSRAISKLRRALAWKRIISAFGSK